MPQAEKIFNQKVCWENDLDRSHLYEPGKILTRQKRGYEVHVISYRLGNQRSWCGTESQKVWKAQAKCSHQCPSLSWETCDRYQVKSSHWLTFGLDPWHLRCGTKCLLGNWVFFSPQTHFSVYNCKIVYFGVIHATVNPRLVVSCHS